MTLRDEAYESLGLSDRQMPAVASLAGAKDAMFLDAMDKGDGAWLLARIFVYLVNYPENDGDFNERCRHSLSALNDAIEHRIGELHGVGPQR